MKKLIFLLSAFLFSFSGFAGYYHPVEMADSSKPLSEFRQSKDSNILIVLDGKIIGHSKNIKSIDDFVNPDSIKSVNVYKEKDAFDKYGERAKEGVVEIFTNKYFEKQEKFFNSKLPDPVSDYEIIFDKVDIEATFPGGDLAWRRFLEQNVNGTVGTDNGAPVGIYTVYVQFLVDKEGHITDVKALTNIGYGMEEEVIRVIKKGPNWVPASQSGKTVKAYRKQPLTFQIEDDLITVRGKRGYTLMAGKDNPVAIQMGKAKDEDLEFTISNGSITRISEGNYNIRVDSPGRVILTVVNKRKKNESSRVSFEVI